MTRRLICFILIALILALPICLSTEISKTLNYDLNGNLVKDIENQYEYNALNQLVKVTDKDGIVLEEYGYDYNGNRIKKVDYHNHGSNTTTYYIGKNFVRVVNSSGVYDTKYIYANNQLIARQESNGDKYFYHPDHLGSTTLVTDFDGDEVETTDYLPYGEIIEGGNDRFTFTGKEKDNAGLMYYGARYYSPLLRTFTQPDTILPDPYDPQQLNRYAYVRNNPLKYTDESGNSATLVVSLKIVGNIFFVGAVTGAVLAISYTIGSIGVQYVNTGKVNMNYVKADYLMGWKHGFQAVGTAATPTFALASTATQSYELTASWALLHGSVTGAIETAEMNVRAGRNELYDMDEGITKGIAKDMLFEGAFSQLGNIITFADMSSDIIDPLYNKAQTKTDSKSSNNAAKSQREGIESTSQNNGGGGANILDQGFWWPFERSKIEEINQLWFGLLSPQEREND